MRPSSPLECELESKAPLPLEMRDYLKAVSRLGIPLSTGFMLSLVIGPCSTPIFASALSYAAYGQNAAYGGVLLFVYGLGAGIPIMLSGAAIGRFAQRLERAGFGAWINRADGASILLLRFYLFRIA